MGELSEPVAKLWSLKTRHLDPESRRRVDQQLKAAGITKMGFKTATACVRKAAYEADRHGYVRGRTERRHRRVGVRPAPDTMAVLTGYLPVEQGICLLRRTTTTRRWDGGHRR